MRLGVVNVFEARHVEVHRHIGDDGFPCAVVFSPIAVETDDGREFFLPQGEAAIDEDGIRYTRFRYADGDKPRLMRKIREHGIDPDYWIEVEPYDAEAEYEAAWYQEHASYGLRA